MTAGFLLWYFQSAAFAYVKEMNTHFTKSKEYHKGQRSQRVTTFFRIYNLKAMSMLIHFTSKEKNLWTNDV